MGNKTIQTQSFSNISSSKLLSLYSLVCEMEEQHMGRLKIYRKKEFNYDYIAMADKLLPKECMEDCKNLISLCNTNKRLLMGNKDGGQDRPKIYQDAELWMKVYTCEITPMDKMNQNLMPLKICIAYLNFTLKQYIVKNAANLFFSQEVQGQKKGMPKHLAYIFGSILDAYGELRNLHEIHPCLNILSMITSITTPSLMYLNVDGCLKFLPIPLFIFSDNFDKMDQCMIDCCRFSNQNEKMYGRNIIIPKYGSTTTSSGQGIQKLDKQFLIRFKKLAKYIRNEIDVIMQNRGSQESSQTISSYLSQNQHKYQYSNYSKGQNYRKQKVTEVASHNEFWDLIENTNSVDDLVKMIKSIENLPQCLQFAGEEITLENLKKNKSLKAEKIKLDRYSKYGSSVNRTINDINPHHIKQPQNRLLHPDNSHYNLPNKKNQTVYNISQNNPNQIRIKDPINNVSQFPQQIPDINLKFTDKISINAHLQSTRPGTYRPAQTTRTGQTDKIWNQRLGAYIL